jgi:hypothetical protein
MKFHAYLTASLAVLLTAGCNSGKSDDYRADFPTAEDSYESAGGDNNLTTAGTIEVGAALQSRSIYPQGDQDWAAVQLEEDVVYELFTTNLNDTGDTLLELYDENGSRLMTANDNYINSDSNIGAYTARYTGTYYLAVTSSQAETLTSYQLGVRVHIDEDGDGFTPTYDCDDHDDTVYPWAVEIPGDGIDQDCFQEDAPAAGSADRYEPDNDIAHASELYSTETSVQELQHQTDTHFSVHTIHEPGDQDFFRFTLAPHSAAHVVDSTFDSSQGEVTAAVLDGNGTEFLNDTGWIDIAVENPFEEEKTYYVRFEASDGLRQTWYAPVLIPLGSDNDGDGFYTLEENADCDDTNASIAPFAAETAYDGIDSNCNGDDNT